VNPTVGTDSYNFFFAAAPFVILAAILAVTYVVKRREWASNVPIGQSYACANCGRHGHRDQCSRSSTTVRWAGIVRVARSPLTPAPCPQNPQSKNASTRHRQGPPGILMDAAKCGSSKSRTARRSSKCSALAVDARLQRDAQGRDRNRGVRRRPGDSRSRPDLGRHPRRLVATSRSERNHPVANAGMSRPEVGAGYCSWP